MRDALVVGEPADDVELDAALVVVGERLDTLDHRHEAVLVDAVHLTHGRGAAACNEAREGMSWEFRNHDARSFPVSADCFLRPRTLITSRVPNKPLKMPSFFSRQRDI